MSGMQDESLYTAEAQSFISALFPMIATPHSVRDMTLNQPWDISPFCGLNKTLPKIVGAEKENATESEVQRTRLPRN